MDDICSLHRAVDGFNDRSTPHSIRRFEMTHVLKAAAAALLLAMPALVMAEETPDATITFSARTVAIGVGVSWGKGTLHYRGKDYAFNVDALSVLNLGGDKIEGTGEVYHLDSIEEFSGTYAAVSAGATVSSGEVASSMKNQHGVVIHMHSNAKGLRVNASLEGVTMKLAGNQ